MHCRPLTASLCTLLAGAFFPACVPETEILSRTELAGSVNSAPVAGSIAATISVDRGGTSTCEFTSLPRGFNPGTFGTHT